MSPAPTSLILAETAVTLAGIYAVWWWILRPRYWATRNVALKEAVLGRCGAVDPQGERRPQDRPQAFHLPEEVRRAVGIDLGLERAAPTLLTR